MVHKIGKQVNARNNMGRTALHIASERGEELLFSSSRLFSFDLGLTEAMAYATTEEF